MSKIKEILIATRNPAKVNNYRHLFTGFVDNVIGLGDTDIVGQPIESGNTAEENVQIKSEFYSSRINIPVFCEDEALYVDFLPQELQPGTHVRRINGKNEATDDELFSYWENLIKKVPVDQRTGRWHIAYGLALNGNIKRVVAIDYEIKFYHPASKIRIPGWPMSSLQGSIKFNKPNSERTEEEKQIILKEDAPIILGKLKELF